MEFYINEHRYQVVKMIGRGKGGYSYLCEKDEMKYIVKKIHHEPCSYYKFSNKFQSEINSYNELVRIGIKVPALIEYDEKQELLVKEYIEGKTIDKYVLEGTMEYVFYSQIHSFQNFAKNSGYNLDYFPTNFVVNNHLIYYIDFELNEYSDQWNYDNWGSQYWNKSKEFNNYFHSSSIELFTDKMILRKFRFGDEKAIFESYGQDIDSFSNVNSVTFRTIEETKIYLENEILPLYNAKSTFYWAIVLIDTHQIIGRISLNSSRSGFYPAVFYQMKKTSNVNDLLDEALDKIFHYLNSLKIEKMYIEIPSNNENLNCKLNSSAWSFVKNYPLTLNGKDNKIINMNLFEMKRK